MGKCWQVFNAKFFAMDFESVLWSLVRSSMSRCQVDQADGSGGPGSRGGPFIIQATLLL